MSDVPPQRRRLNIDLIVIAGMVAVALAFVLVMVVSQAGDPAAANDDRSSSSTATSSPVDTERAVIDACHHSIIERGADQLASAKLTWETSNTTHTGVGRYDVEGAFRAEELGASWRFSYTCKVIAAQSGDGSGGWVAVDQGFDRL